MPIFKAVYRVTVLGHFDSPAHADTYFALANLDNVLSAAQDGDMIGEATKELLTVVPDECVREELLAIGNDGDFFDFLNEYEDEEDDE